MALSNVALFGAAFLTPVIGGKISYELGWQWTFYLLAIFGGIALPFMVLFVPETAFRRASRFNTDYEGDSNRSEALSGYPQGKNSSDGAEGHQSLGLSEGREDKEILSELNGNTAHAPTDQPGHIPEKDSFVKSLRLFNGRKTDENFFKLLLRPFPLFLHPGILWVGPENNSLVLTP